MKSNSRIFLSRALTGALLATVLAAGSFVHAAAVPAAKPDPVKQAQDLAAYRAGMANAKTLAAGNNLAAAEQALVAINKARPNSAGWYLETAQRLIETAESLARDGKPAGVPALANRALQLLSQAETAAKTARTKAAAISLSGFIHDRYLANRPAALAAYQGALTLVPLSARAKEAVARLQQTDENLQIKQRGGGR